MRKKVYISGPISNGGGGDRITHAQHMLSAIPIWSELLDAGYSPLLPHFTVFGDLFYRHSHECYLESCKPWVLASDAVLRLDGESVGADIEVDWAESAGIPVFHSVVKLRESVKP